MLKKLINNLFIAEVIHATFRPITRPIADLEDSGQWFGTPAARVELLQHFLQHFLQRRSAFSGHRERHDANSCCRTIGHRLLERLEDGENMPKSHRCLALPTLTNPLSTAGL